MPPLSAAPWQLPRLPTHQVQTAATLPSIAARCASAGQRVFVLKDIQLQQERTVTLGFGTGSQIWKSALKHPLTLASGDNKRKVSAGVATTLQLYCYVTASTADGVNKARAVYEIAFRPRDPADKPTTRLVTQIVHYRLGYC